MIAIADVVGNEWYINPAHVIAVEKRRDRRTWHIVLTGDYIIDVDDETATAVIMAMKKVGQ